MPVKANIECQLINIRKLIKILLIHILIRFCILDIIFFIYLFQANVCIKYLEITWKVSHKRTWSFKFCVLQTHGFQKRQCFSFHISKFFYFDCGICVKILNNYIDASRILSKLNFLIPPRRHYFDKPTLWVG